MFLSYWQGGEALKRGFETSVGAEGHYPPLSNQPPPKAARPSHAPLHSPLQAANAAATDAAGAFPDANGHVFMSSDNGNNITSSSVSNTASSGSSSGNNSGEDTESAARAMMMLVSPPSHSDAVGLTQLQLQPLEQQQQHQELPYSRNVQGTAFASLPPAPVPVSSFAASAAVNGPPGIPPAPAAVAADAAIPPMPPQWGSELDGLLDGVNL